MLQTTYDESATQAGEAEIDGNWAWAGRDPPARNRSDTTVMTMARVVRMATSEDEGGRACGDQAPREMTPVDCSGPAWIPQPGAQENSRAHGQSCTPSGRRGQPEISAIGRWHGGEA